VKKTSEEFLKKLLEAPSPSGFEQPAAAVFAERVKGAVDELIADVHGNVIAVLNPKAKFKFMISGHIDEIGLIITHIDEKGYIYTAQIGGMDPALRCHRTKGDPPDEAGRAQEKRRNGEYLG